MNKTCKECGAKGDVYVTGILYCIPCWFERYAPDAIPASVRRIHDNGVPESKK